MPQPALNLRTIALLLVPPVLWASNAVLGRLVREWVPPITLNFLRWSLALVLLLPWAAHVLRPTSALWPHWRRYGLLGLLGVGCYNALQYLALQSSTPINVTLVASSMPLWVMATGALCFGARITSREVVGALLSVTGVLVVLSHGDWQQLRRLHLVPGDLFMLLATVCWAFYSWLMLRTTEPAALRADWAGFLMAQMVFGVAWSAAATGAEWALLPGLEVRWGGPLAAVLLFVAVGPSLLAFYCWGTGVQRIGPALASFFANLTPLFAALLSALVLGEWPHLYHGAAFALIVAGIVVSSRR